MWHLPPGSQGATREVAEVNRTIPPIHLSTRDSSSTLAKITLPPTPASSSPNAPGTTVLQTTTNPERQAPQRQLTLQTPQNAHPSNMQLTFSGDMSRYTS
ncbi:hypothetical protein K503DRAFT_771658 [Rhizopogon vinicolor AM-OR11-026]|uniref:Uncharacterized protein n=1 Tax=Rhizopogon vinicolor AM-OR11-026 TaxID=1314800 RepID=A0A1B7MXC2_9AGAM|nr:hypothetical protein K503DRAFT_771658 [Rhizopogon vinicolor AM-OR11-026]